MDLKALNKSNIDNLTSLWQKFGAHPVATLGMTELHGNNLWPNRYWFDWDTFTTEKANQVISQLPIFCSELKQLPKLAIVPVWLAPNALTSSSEKLEQCLIDSGFKLGFEQVAMYLDIQEYTAETRQSIEVKEIRSSQDIQTWVEIASDSFGYEIDTSVIQALAGDADVRLLLGYDEGRAVASAMLYKTADIIGVHQVGVAQKYQGKGIAYSLMQHVIRVCNAWHGKYIMLQASDAGKMLYKRLGFKQQFLIRNYQTISINN